MNITYTALAFITATLSVGTVVHSHEISDNEFCAEFNDENFGGAVEFGYQLKTWYSLARYLELGAPDSFRVRTGRTPLVNAKILPCKRWSDVSYSDDKEFCLYPRFEGIAGLESFPEATDWEETLEHNEQRREFLKICPISYSETEQRLFLLTQEQQIESDTLEALEVLSSQFLRRETEACVKLGETNGELENMQQQYETNKAKQAKDCESSMTKNSLGYRLCMEYGSAITPIGLLRGECRAKAWEQDEFQRYLNIYDGLRR
jgi:hypothetical protein